MLDNTFFMEEARHRGWIEGPGTATGTCAFLVKSITNERERMEAFLCESLACALAESIEPICLLRTALQTQYYLGRLEGLGAVVKVSYRDGIAAVKNRTEKLLTI